jgi:glycosyltransferase involved in cell wall biosynthesis
MRVLTCLGDATVIDTWSNTPFFLLAAGKRAGFLDDGWRLNTQRLRYHRLAWNAWRSLSGKQMLGFQYSPLFLRRLLAQVEPIDADIEVISHFPLFPPLGRNAPKTSYYIDATLTQNFNDYGLAGPRGVGQCMVANSIARERDQYAAAERVVCMSSWAARSVVEHYGISRHKVHVVPPGSNLHPDATGAAVDISAASLTPVRLGFLGKDWRRKNLQFVLAVADVLHARGVPVEVLAAGFDPGTGPRHPRMKALGFIDKRLEMKNFIEFIRSCHFTCLFSTAEASGLSMRESLRLGVPVLGRDVGGISDTMPNGCGQLFDRTAPSIEVAEFVEAYVREPDRYWALRGSVARRREEFTWATSVRKLQAVWSGSHEYCYAHLASPHV